MWPLNSAGPRHNGHTARDQPSQSLSPSRCLNRGRSSFIDLHFKTGDSAFSRIGHEVLTARAVRGRSVGTVNDMGVCEELWQEHRYACSHRNVHMCQPHADRSRHCTARLSRSILLGDISRMGNPVRIHYLQEATQSAQGIHLQLS